MNMQARPPLMPMSGEQRSKLRRAIVEQPESWKIYRDRHGLSMDKMTAQNLWDAALYLGINPVETISAETDMNAEHHKPRPFTKEHVQALWDRCAAAVNHTSHKDMVLCANIFTTINTKQDGRATIKQFDTIDRIVSKAEEWAASKAARQGEQKSPEQKKAEEAFRKAIHGHDAANGHDVPEAPKTAPEAPKGLVRPTDKKALLEAILEGMGGQLDEEAVGALVDTKIKEALAGIPTLRIEVKAPDREPIKLDGLHHALFPELLLIIAARTADDKPLNIWIAGPAGSGKTTAAIACALALGLSFHGNGAISHPVELFGYKDAGGAYHRTAFREAYEHGGVYVFDDTDGSDPTATVAFNMALENGHCPFPDGMVQRHPDCVIIATANTFGHGATADYVGRNRMDGAFLDRFHVKLPWDYDTGLESAMCGNAQWADRVIAARARARHAGLKVLITPRASKAGAALIASGMKPDRAAALTYLAGLTAEQIKIVEGK